MSCSTAQPGRLRRLLVTRPAAEAQSWVAALQAQAWPAQALPLIEIGEPQDAQLRAALDRARAHWPQWNALMFVSGAAVQHFFAQAVAPAPSLPSGVCRTRFWAPGPGTAKALAEALQTLGLDASWIDSPAPDAPQFDSEHLWPVVAGQLQAGTRLLLVRGTSPEGRESAVPGQGRDWLLARAREAGAEVDACVAYERRPPTWSAEQHVLALESTQPGSLWLLSSSEAVSHLRVLLPQADWSEAAALTTHERIADAARAAGFGTVLISRPALPDVLRTLESSWTPL